MSTPLMFAVIFIVLAFTFYTIGVMWERKDKELRGIHMLFFCLGLTCDTIGTSFMGSFSSGGFSPHLATGAVGLVLMTIHAIWAAVTLIQNNAKSKERFHRFSVCVWLFWLIPFVSGMLMGIPVTHLDSTSAILTAIAVAAITAILVLRQPKKHT